MSSPFLECLTSINIIGVAKNGSSLDIPDPGISFLESIISEVGPPGFLKLMPSPCIYLVPVFPLVLSSPGAQGGRPHPLS